MAVESEALNTEVICLRKELNGLLKVKSELDADVKALQHQNQDLNTALQSVETDLVNERTAREIAVSQYRENEVMAKDAQARIEDLERENLTFVERIKGMSAEVEERLNMINEMELKLREKEESLQFKTQRMDDVVRKELGRLRKWPVNIFGWAQGKLPQESSQVGIEYIVFHSCADNTYPISKSGVRMPLESSWLSVTSAGIYIL